MTYPKTTLGVLADLFTMAAVLTTIGQASAQAPRVGDVQRLQVVTLSLQVGSTETQTRQVTYTPPPGWYVRSHQVDCTARYGNSSFTVSTVPQHWHWSSEGRVRDCYRLLLDLAARAQDAGLQARLRQEQDRLLAELRKVRSSHHALVVEATAKGGGLLRGGGGLQLAVTAELVYVGTQESLEKDVARHRARLK
jgi:hypothetical protein